MSRPRYALGLVLPDGARWLVARNPSRCGPIRTADPAFAHTWESVEGILEWLDDIPIEAGPGAKSKSCGWWMEGLELVAVPLVTARSGEPIALARRESSTLEGVAG